MAASSSAEGASRRVARYVLPIAGGAALALGSLAVSGLHNAFDRYLPVASVAVGVTTLWASFVPYASGRTPRPGLNAVPARGPVHVVPTPSARPAARTIPPEKHHLRPSEAEKRERGAVPAHVAKPGDELWRHWATPKTSLGAALVGPVPETAYSPSRSGAVAPFAARDRDVVFPSDLPRVPNGVGTPSRTADIALRPFAPSAPAKAGATESPSNRAPPPFREVGSYFGGSVGLLPLLDSLDYESSEMTELPSSAEPHLELNDRAKDWLDRASCSPTRRTLARFCSGCSRRLDDFREWVHCRQCREPVCQECLSESFSTNGRGLCNDCRETKDPPPDLVTRTLQRGPSLAPKWVGS